ncbi:MAG: N-acetylglucosamine-6-phosphate deacetylase [Thermoprotei archaeon]|jgi:N-acetylglucosamine-6-phosphate deacetylase
MKTIKGIVAGKLITPKEEINNIIIEFDEKIIADIRPFSGEIPKDFLDAKNMIVTPGFIDIHIHGAEGFDATRDDYYGIKNMSKILPKYGITGFMPTAICSPKDRFRRFIQIVYELWKTENEGARVLGAHLEGPFINPKKKGAQPIEHIRKPDLNELHEYINLRKEMPFRLTIAPELEGAYELISEASKNDVIISMGHSDATFDEAKKGFNAGAKLVTHLFNAMREFHHREPGLPGFALTNDEVYVEIISDFIHIHPETLKLIIKTKPLDKIVLITDAIEAAGLPDGKYQLGQYAITVINRKATLPDGTIAGSTLTIDNAVKNMVKIGLPLRYSILMSTLVPAEILKSPNIGKIEIGKEANLVILDNDLNVRCTIIHGKIFWCR